jgi:hypothetical protein
MNLLCTSDYHEFGRDDEEVHGLAPMATSCRRIAARSCRVAAGSRRVAAEDILREFIE